MARLDTADAELVREIEQFLFYEAQLLDDREFETWLGLLSEDIRYWMPTRFSQGRRQRRDSSDDSELAHFDDDWPTLELRVKRLRTAFAWAEQPPTRTRRLIGNIRVAPANAGRFAVRSNFICYANRLESETHIWAGERSDVLRRSGDSWLICDRMIKLDQNVLLANCVSLLF
jgi:3-phenylpropionate/cinnamic acid dioxygenase small subunit